MVEHDDIDAHPIIEELRTWRRHLDTEFIRYKNKLPISRNYIPVESNTL